MKSILISPGPGQYCSDDFIDTIYTKYDPDFAKCFYNNISAVASWETGAIPSNVSGVLIKSTRDRVGDLPLGLYWVLLVMAIMLGAFGLLLCCSIRVKFLKLSRLNQCVTCKKSSEGNKEDFEMQLMMGASFL
jgi:hypothetical protein